MVLMAKKNIEDYTNKKFGMLTVKEKVIINTIEIDRSTTPIALTVFLIDNCIFNLNSIFQRR